MAAAGHAVAMMLGLFAGHRTGAGQTVESSMIVSNIYLNFEDALAYEGKPPRAAVDPRQFGTGPTHRLYECAPSSADSPRLPHGNPDPRWIMVVADDDAARARLASTIGTGDLSDDGLSAVFLTRPAHEWESVLLSADIGCVVADAASHFAFLYEDAQAQATGMMTTAEHPSLGGHYRRYAPVLQMSATPGIATSFCDLGEHSRALLVEHGFDGAEVEELATDGVVGITTVSVG